MLTIETWFGQDPRLEQALDVRKVVFVDEQAVPLDEELDGKDGVTWHLMAMMDGVPVGTARVFPGEVVKVGRVAVLKRMRGQAIGAQIMAACEALARNLGATGIKLEAQVTALRFYEKLGYVAEGDVFLDANIAHRLMTLVLGDIIETTRDHRT